MSILQTNYNKNPENIFFNFTPYNHYNEIISDNQTATITDLSYIVFNNDVVYNDNKTNIHCNREDDPNSCNKHIANFFVTTNGKSLPQFSRPVLIDCSKLNEPNECVNEYKKTEVFNKIYDVYENNLKDDDLIALKKMNNVDVSKMPLNSQTQTEKQWFANELTYQFIKPKINCKGKTAKDCETLLNNFGVNGVKIHNTAIVDKINCSNVDNSADCLKLLKNVNNLENVENVVKREKTEELNNLILKTGNLTVGIAIGLILCGVFYRSVK